MMASLFQDLMHNFCRNYLLTIKFNFIIGFDKMAANDAEIDRVSKLKAGFQPPPFTKMF